MIRKKLIPLLFIGASMTQINAQTAPTGKGNTDFTLQQAIEYAMKNSPNYLTSTLDVESAAYRRKELLGAGLPQINGSVDLKDYIEIPTSLIPAQFFGGPAGTFRGQLNRWRLTKRV